MLASVISATLLGVDGQVVTVEVHIASGLPGYHVVGLPDTAVRESRERVRAAVQSSRAEVAVDSHHRQPRTQRHPKGGRGTRSRRRSSACCCASDELPPDVLDGVAVLGELGLDGTVRHVPGTLALVDAVSRAGCSTVIVPPADAAEAALVPGVDGPGRARPRPSSARA